MAWLLGYSDTALELYFTTTLRARSIEIVQPPMRMTTKMQLQCEFLFVISIYVSYMCVVCLSPLTPSPQKVCE